MFNIKSFVIVGLALIISFGTCLAQSKKELRFVYVNHSISTDTQKLIMELRQHYDDARNYPDDIATVFYMSNNTNPIVVKVNTEGDNQQDFNAFIMDIQDKRYHEVNRSVDVRGIVETYSSVDDVPEYGVGKFSKVLWYYYLSPEFWEMQYNETIISSVYWILDMQKMQETGYIKFYLFHDEAMTLPIDKTYPFGKKNLCPNYTPYPLPY